MRDYTLTEPVCLQAVIISLKSRGWDEWFSNPTAGPWKRIRIPGVQNLKDIGFEKEETRPDLIVYNAKNSVVLVLEVKDNIEKLIDVTNNNHQLIKTISVFDNIITRLTKILKNNNSKISSSSIIYCGGYVVSKTDYLDSKIIDLKKIHFAKTSNLRNELKQFVVFVVEKKNLDLFVSCNAYKENNKPLSILEKII